YCHGPSGRVWKLIPSSAIQTPTVRLRGMATPLLVEEGYTTGGTAVAQIADPVGVAGSVLRAALPTRDNPVQVVKFQRRQRSEKRLGADEADGRRDSAKVMIRAPGVPVEFDTGAGPDIRRPCELGGQ